MKVTAPMAVRIKPQISLWGSECSITRDDDADFEGDRRLLAVLRLLLVLLRVILCQLTGINVRCLVRVSPEQQPQGESTNL